MDSKITIAEIASEAGVSTGTVSRVLNGQRYVHPATRDTVLKVIERTGYVPDSGARRLARGKREIVAVAPFEQRAARSPYYVALLDALQEEFLDRGFVAKVMDPDRDDMSRCAGVILPGIHIDE